MSFDASTPSSVRSSGETRIELATEVMPGYFYEVDWATGQTVRGPGFHELLGYDDRPEHDADWWISLIHPDDYGPERQRHVQAVLDDPKSEGYRLEYRVLHADGSWRWVADHNRLLRDDRGHIVRLIGFTADITRQREAEQERLRLFREAQQARAAAEKANEAKSRYLATISHELRTPLTAIAGYGELLEMEIAGPVNRRQREYLLRMREAERTLIGLVDGILDLARIESGHVEFTIAPVRITAVLDRVHSLVEPEITRHHIAWTRSAPPGPLLANADEEKLQRILLNLVSNAIKFTPDGGQITVRADQRDGKVICEVTDSGRGIAEDHIETIFEPFVRVHMEGETITAGTGLGLAICRQLARGMGGDVRVTSEVGAGSTFTVTVPTAQDN